MKSYSSEFNAILYVGRELKYQEFFSLCLSDTFSLYSANSVLEAKWVIQQVEIKVVIVNRDLGASLGTDFLDFVHLRFPDVVVVAAEYLPYAYIKHSSEHESRFFYTFHEPLHRQKVLQVLKSAVELYNTRQEKKKLTDDLQAERLNALESDRLKAYFLSNLSHEIRTPLNSILGFSALANNVSDKEKIREYNEIIGKSCDQLLSIVDNIITTSNLHVGNVKKNDTIFDLAAFFRSIAIHYTPLLREKKLSLRVYGLDADDLIVVSDKSKLHEVFCQLLNNAIKFTASGFIEIGVLKERDYLFYVKDTGIGIDRDKQKDIFKTFHQGHNDYISRNYGGNGLGLSIVKGLIEMVNGEIWVESEKGAGSTFFFAYPLKVVEPNVAVH